MLLWLPIATFLNVHIFRNFSRFLGNALLNSKNSFIKCNHWSIYDPRKSGRPGGLDLVGPFRRLIQGRRGGRGDFSTLSFVKNLALVLIRRLKYFRIILRFPKDVGFFEHGGYTTMVLTNAEKYVGWVSSKSTNEITTQRKDVTKKKKLK